MKRIISPFFEDVCPNLVGGDISRNRRGIAQSGSASGLGPEGREFESLYPDHFKTKHLPRQKIA